MPYKDPIKEKERSIRRREYFRKYRREHPNITKRESFGYRGEEIALTTLKNSVRAYNPTDLKWEGKRVEVKISKKRLVPKCKTYLWRFFLKQLRRTDLFLLICTEKDEVVRYIFLIPDKELKVKNFSLHESRLHKYFQFLLKVYK